MAITKFKGVAIEIAGVVYIIPALTLRSVQALQERLTKYTGQLNAESVELVLDTVHAALARNYPDMTRDAVADMVDLSNMAALMNAVMGVSGLVERNDTGEAVATV